MVNDPQITDPGAQLMLAFQAGDEASFEQLIEQYSERAYALFVRFTGGHEGSEDLVQELFLRMWGAKERYQPTARFSTWMYRIAFNLAANAGMRKRSRKALSLQTEDGQARSASLQLVDEGVPNPEDGMVREDVARQVQAAIAELPDSQRMALILARYEELSHQEIADAIDSSAAAVKSLIHRARETLRERLAHLIAEDLA